MWIKQFYNQAWCDMVHQTVEKYPDQPGDYETHINLDPTKADLRKENYLMKAIPTKKEKLLADYMKEVVTKANSEMYGFNIWYDIDIIQYTTYDSNLNMEFPWHTDSVWYGLPVVQKLTVVIGLTDSKKYEGGELVLFGRKDFAIKLTAGQAVVFPSIVWHKVNPVTSGKRNTLVSWYKGPRWM